MPRSVYDTVLIAAVGLLAGGAIWTVADVAYDDPAAGLSKPSPACPQEGIRVTAGPVNPALGLRAMDLTLENCGTRAYRVQGYPEIRLLDRDQQILSGVSVIHGSGGIAKVTGFDDPSLGRRRGPARAEVLAERPAFRIDEPRHRQTCLSGR